MLSVELSLCISFAGMIVILIKYYKSNISKKIDAEIASIVNAIDQVEQEQIESEHKLKQLNTLLHNISVINEENIMHAHKQAEKIMQQSNEETAIILAQKQAEGERAIMQIRHGVEYALKNKLVKLAVENAAKEMHCMTRAQHNKQIEKALDLMKSI